MYFNENTLESKEMRSNVLRLLQSNYEPNYTLAILLIVGGGFDFLFFSHIWEGYFCYKNENTQQTCEEILQANLPVEFLEIIQSCLSQYKAQNKPDIYEIFRQFRFYEALIAGKFFSFDTLIQKWYEEDFFQEYPELTVFLLSKGIKLDRALFEQRFFLPAELTQRQVILIERANIFSFLIACGLYEEEELLQHWETLPTQGTPAQEARKKGISIYFLKQKEKTDIRFFLHQNLPMEMLYGRDIDFLLANPNFDKKIFFQRFVKKGVLDLSYMRLYVLPTEIFELPNVHTLNITQTPIKELDWETLTHFQNIKANKRLRYKLQGMVLDSGSVDLGYVYRTAFQRSQLSWEREQYDTVFELLQSAENITLLPSFSQNEQVIYWERYFSSAVFLGNFDEALRIAYQTTVFLRPYQNQHLWERPTFITYFRGWKIFIAEMLSMNRDVELIALLEHFDHIFPNKNYPENSFIFSQLKRYYIWVVSCEYMGLKERWEDFYYLMEKAKNYLPDFKPHQYSWGKIFHYLLIKEKYNEAYSLYKYLENIILSENNQLDIYIVRKFVYMLKTHIEIHRALGKYKELEALYSKLIQYYREAYLIYTWDYFHAKQVNSFAKYAYYAFIVGYQKLCTYFVEFCIEQGDYALADLYRQEYSRLETEKKAR